MNKQYALTVVLVMIITLLVYVHAQKNAPLIINPPTNIVYDPLTKSLDYPSLTLRQKIGQMVVTYGYENNLNEISNLVLGGVHLGAKISKTDFRRTTSLFATTALIPQFITIDLEGCLNPFENFKEFPTFKDITTPEQAYALGKEQGDLLQELGFTLNFSPVVDLEDRIWQCRSFLGTPQQITEKATAYIDGIQSTGILATSKHYPGKTLVSQDPHKTIIQAEVESDDIFPFEETMKNNVSALMVSHQIARGYKDSEQKPSVVSRKLIQELRQQYDGLIITDEISMRGLQDYYTNLDEMYVDLFLAENDVILHFNADPKELNRMTTVIEKAVKKGIISEERIDRSVKRILMAKKINIT